MFGFVTLIWSLLSRQRHWLSKVSRWHIFEQAVCKHLWRVKTHAPLELAILLLRLCSAKMHAQVC